MERKAFLKSLGAGAAFALTFPCANGCSKNDDVESFPVSNGVDFTLDLASSEAAPLENIGGFISIKSNPDFNYFDIVIARNLEGNLIAASKICSHQGTEEIKFISEDGGVFHCSTHQSRFAQDGVSLNLNTTSSPLKIFNTELINNILRVFE